MSRRSRHKSQKGKIAAIAVIVLIVVSIVVAHQLTSGTNTSSPTKTKVLVVTSMGDFTIQLFDNMPLTAGNFRNLVNKNAYDGTIFHRVVHGFVVQGGDVSQTYGAVSPIQDELPNKHSNLVGTVAMAKQSSSSGIIPDSATSQFFINLKDNSRTLDSGFSVFGKVISGMSVVQTIGNVATDTNDKPLQDVTLTSATFID